MHITDILEMRKVKSQIVAIMGINTTKEKKILMILKALNSLESEVKSVSFTKGSPPIKKL